MSELRCEELALARSQAAVPREARRATWSLRGCGELRPVGMFSQSPPGILTSVGRAGGDEGLDWGHG